jgi:DtxR family Mn-dependent transcriptional regulator
MMTVTPVMEKYLKVILDLSKKDGVAHVTDIAQRRQVSKATVSKTLDKLAAFGYVNKEKYGAVWLTAAGEAKAENVKRTFTIIESFLNKILGVREEISSKDACMLEHLLSRQTVEKINNYMTGNKNWR